MSVKLQPTPLFRLLGPEKAGGIEVSANILSFLHQDDQNSLNAVSQHGIITKEEKFLAKILEESWDYQDFKSLIAEIPEFTSCERIKINGTPLEPRLTDLQLQEVLTVQNKEGEVVSRFPNMVSLDLGIQKNFSNSGLAYLQYVPHLKTLSLFGCSQISREGLENLIYLPQLENLDVGNHLNLTNEELEAIVRFCPRLKSLNIQNTGITSLQPLTQLEHLEHLSMGTSLIPKEELEEELSHLPRRLRSLNMSSCQISNRNIEQIAVCRELRKLDLSFNRDITSLQTLANSFPHLEELELTACGGIEDFTPLGSLQHLRKLDVHYCPNIKGALPRLTPVWKKMEELSLTNCELEDDHCRFLASLTRLCELDLSSGENHRTRITDQGIRQLAPLENLKWLYIRECEQIRMTPREIQLLFPKLKSMSGPGSGWTLLKDRYGRPTFISTEGEGGQKQSHQPTIKYTAPIAAVACAAIAVIGAYFYRL